RMGSGQVPPGSGHPMSNRGASRSATATPTGSPQKRRLPQIPRGDFDDRSSRMMKGRLRNNGGRRGGYSDTELVESEYEMQQRGYYTAGEDVLPPPHRQGAGASHHRSETEDPPHTAAHGT
ncbi:Uncharacterized protein FKW44_008251, partial [Caligus rogercresseyi]